MSSEQIIKQKRFSSSNSSWEKISICHQNESRCFLLHDYLVLHSGFIVRFVWTEAENPQIIVHEWASRMKMNLHWWENDQLILTTIRFLLFEKKMLIVKRTVSLQTFPIRSEHLVKMSRKCSVDDSCKKRFLIGHELFYSKEHKDRTVLDNDQQLTIVQHGMI